jgi:Domain of unknown function (DUF4129)
MTSRQPGPPPSGSLWLVRVLPLAFLIMLGLAGLRGAVAKPQWDGPWQRHGVVIGLVLELVLGILLVITVRRRARLARTALAGGPVNSVAVKLRGVLIFMLGTGMVAVAVTILLALHLHMFTAKVPLRRTQPQPQGTGRTPSITPPHPSTFHFPATALLYALLVVLLVAAIVLSIWWSRRFRSLSQATRDGFIVEDSQDLREAVDAGRSALRTLDDARAAIIACYLAMEAHLAERGTTRAVADTPDELLARARATGLVRGTAAARLTALFYEARFSSHPLDRSHRDAAAEALDELAAALAETEPAPAEAGGSA